MKGGDAVGKTLHPKTRRWLPHDRQLGTDEKLPPVLFAGAGIAPDGTQNTPSRGAIYF